MPVFLDHSDPRLGLRAAPAALEAPVTRAAIRLLGDALARMGVVVLAAPAFGLPVRVMGVREGDTISYLLNPKIESLGAMDLSMAELSPHTGPIRRNVRRAKTIAVSGSDLSGAPCRIELAEAAAVQAQQGFDLMDRPMPFGWMTPFHHLIVREGDNARRAMLIGLNTGLYAAGQSGGQTGGQTAGQDQPVCLAGQNSMSLHPDGGGITLATIDGLDPTRPQRDRARAQLALMAALPAGRNALFCGTKQLDLAVSSLMVFAGLTTLVAAKAPLWPQRAIEQFGLGSVLRRIDVDVMNFVDLPSGMPALDTIVVDRPEETARPDHAALRRMARALTGASGALILSRNAPDPVIEDALQASFPAVYVIEAAPDHLMYLALKTPLDPGQVRAQLLHRSHVTGVGHLTDLLGAPWLHLRKDGQRVTL